MAVFLVASSPSYALLQTLLQRFLLITNFSRQNLRRANCPFAGYLHANGPVCGAATLHAAGFLGENGTQGMSDLWSGNSATFFAVIDGLLMGDYYLRITVTGVLVLHNPMALFILRPSLEQTTGPNRMKFCMEPP